MLSIDFHYRPSVRQGVRDGKVFIRLIHQRRSGCVTLPYPVRQEDWTLYSSRLKDPTSFSLLSKTEQLLLKEKELLHSIVNELKEKGSFTIRDVLNVYHFRKKRKDLSALTQELSEELIALGKERTARAYRTTLHMLQAYMGCEQIYPEKLTAGLLDKYEKYMQDQCKSLNTISFYMRNLRAIYNKGIKRGFFPAPTENPFNGVYTKVAPTRKRALTKPELRKLENLLDDPESLNKEEKTALSLFLFSFHSRGMCFVDVAHLRKSDVANGMIHYYRKKTGQYMELKLTPSMRKYMKYISASGKSPYQFFIIQPERPSSYKQYCTGLRRQNRLLKQIGQKAGLREPLTTHIARHSWATVAKMEQIPVEVISEALGHTRLDTTYRYLGSFGESVLDKANRKVAKAIRRAG